MSLENFVQLYGNFCFDPELRHTPDGKAVVNCKIATNEVYNGVEKAEFHAVVFWGKLAQTVATHCAKGSRVFLQGRLQYREIERRTGKCREAEIHAFTVKFIDRAKVRDRQPVDYPLDR